MSSAPEANVVAGHAAHPAPEFVCAEVWGGNRPIDRAIELPGVRGRVYSHPCEGGRGGDIHYISICSSGLLSRLCLADVAGHGQSVAHVSDEIHGLLRRYMNTGDERRVLSELNRRLMKDTPPVMTTAVAISYYPPARTLAVSYAGHPPAWLYRQETGRWSLLPTPPRDKSDRRTIDLPLAVDSQTAFSRRKLPVVPGDRLFALTDGVLEAPAPDGEQFGVARLSELLHEHREEPIADIAGHVLKAVIQHTGDSRLPHDDVTLLAIEFVSGPRGPALWHVLKNRVLGARRRVPRPAI
jgi:phosphoserine phosphatase RsbU/P